MTVTVKDDIYFIVEQAIDYAFEKKKFLLKFYDYLKSSKTTGIEVKEFNTSSTASELTEVIHELDELNEKELSSIDNRKDGKVEIIDVAVNALPTHMFTTSVSPKLALTMAYSVAASMSEQSKTAVLSAVALAANV